MAVQIPQYRQQTGTPQATVRGGPLMNVGVADMAGAIGSLAHGAASLVNRRREEKEGIASAWAADALAGVQREAPRKMDEFKQNAGEGGTGVIEGINGWMESRTAELLEQAPTEAAKTFLTDRLREYRTRLDLGAYDYEQGERLNYTAGKFDSSIEQGAAAAAANPDMAPTIIQEIRAAIQSNPILTPEAKRQKEEMLIQTVSYADVLGELERDPYRAQGFLRSRIGIASNATPKEVQLHMEGAMKLLEETEEAGGFTVPAGQREEAIAALMAGGRISVDNETNEVIFVGDPETSGVPMTYGALSVPKVIELLGRADAEIARRENAAKQGQDFGRLLFRQEINDRMATLRAGESAIIPPFEQIAHFMGEEQAILVQREMQVAQSMQGELAGMDGMSNEELFAIAAAAPTGTDNRQFRDEAYRIKAGRIQQIMAARKDDPGGYALANSPVVQQAAARVEQLQGEVNTPEDRAAYQAAQRQYIEALNTEQRRLGILEPKLPKNFVAGVAQRFSQGMTGDQAPQAAAMLEGMAFDLLDSPEAIEQLAKETGLAGTLAFSGVDGMTIKRIQNMAQLPKAKVKESLPAGVEWGEVEQAVADEFAPLDATFQAQGAPVDQDQWRSAAQLLVADLLHSGRADTPTRAAKMAYAKLFSDRNAVKGTYRVPLALPVGGEVIPVDPNEVEAGLFSFMQNITPETMRFPVDPGSTEEESFKRNMRTVRRNAFWANNQTGTGVILMGPDGPQRRPDGSAIEVSFKEALDLSADGKGARQMDREKLDEVLLKELNRGNL